MSGPDGAPAVDPDEPADATAPWAGTGSDQAGTGSDQDEPPPATAQPAAGGGSDEAPAQGEGAPDSW